MSSFQEFHLIAALLLTLWCTNIHAVMYFCNFQPDFSKWCGWTPSETNPPEYVWYHYQGHALTPGTGPNGDHTTGNGSYLLLEGSKPAKVGARSAVQSEEYLPTSGRCLSFWYHMYGSGSGTLKVIVLSMTTGVSRDVFAVTGDRGNVWLYKKIIIRSTTNFKIVFEGTRGKNIYSDLALDDIYFSATESCKNENTNLCTFGTNVYPWCVWSIPPGEMQQYAWRLTSGPTTTNGTGPAGDHTTGKGYYLYLEASSPAAEGMTASIDGPRFAKASMMCLSFWYHMTGSDVGKLEVLLYLEVSGLHYGLWSNTNEEKNWTYVDIEFYGLAPFKIRIRGVRGRGIRSDIAIDDVALSTGSCSAAAKKRTPYSVSKATTMPYNQLHVGSILTSTRNNEKKSSQRVTETATSIPCYTGNTPIYQPNPSSSLFKHAHFTRIAKLRSPVQVTPMHLNYLCNSHSFNQTTLQSVGKTISAHQISSIKMKTLSDTSSLYPGKGLSPSSVLRTSIPITLAANGTGCHEHNSEGICLSTKSLRTPGLPLIVTQNSIYHGRSYVLRRSQHFIATTTASSHSVDVQSYTNSLPLIRFSSPTITGRTLKANVPSKFSSTSENQMLLSTKVSFDATKPSTTMSTVTPSVVLRTFESTIFFAISEKSINVKGIPSSKDSLLKRYLEEEVLRILTLTPKYGSFSKNITTKLFDPSGSGIKLVFTLYTTFGRLKSSVEYHMMTQNMLRMAAQDKLFHNVTVLASTIFVFSNEFCIPERSGYQSGQGLFKWPLTYLNQFARSSCPHGPENAFGRRKCTVGPLGSVAWGLADLSNCNYGNQMTKRLGYLANMVVTIQNVIGLAKEIANLSSDPTHLTTYDTILLTTIMENIVDSTFVFGKVADLLLVTTSNLMQINRSVLTDAQGDQRILTRIIQNTAKLANSVIIAVDHEAKFTTVASHVALMSTQVNKVHFVGVSFSANFITNSSGFEKENLQLAKEDKETGSISVALKIPRTILKDAKTNNLIHDRIGFVVYKDGSLFKSIRNSQNGTIIERTSSSFLDSFIISVKVNGVETVTLSNPLILTFKHRSTLQGYFRQCSFWDFKENGGEGGWSTTGCRRTSFGTTFTECKCNHLTNFAILFDPHAGRMPHHDRAHQRALSIITYVGVALSLCALFLTLLTMALFSRLRQSRPSKILVSLSVSMMLTLILFIIGTEFADVKLLCSISALLLHYFLLTTFFWMLVEAINLYLSFVKVIGSNINHFMLKSSLSAWGTPVVIVAITGFVSWQDYGNNYVCTVVGYAAYAALFAPIVLTLLLNFVIFFFVVRALGQSKKSVKKDKEVDGKIQLRFAFVCSSLLGLTWIFGVFAILDARLAFQYLFCIFNSGQGFFIFYFHILRKANVQRQWIALLTGRGFKYDPSSTSSRLTVRSTYRLNSERFTSRKCSATPSEVKEIEVSKEFSNPIYNEKVNL